MDMNQQRKVLTQLSKGLAICDRPFLALSQQIGTSEEALVDFVQGLVDSNGVSRFGMVIDHEKVGYSVNAIVVWDVPDEEVDEIGVLLGLQEKISLCYKRPRQLPDWPYNLFTLIHGQSQKDVVTQLNKIVSENDIEQYASDILFSTQTFKHTGSRFDW